MCCHNAILANVCVHIYLQALYARSAARFPSFHEPQLGWWSRRKVPKADKADEGELAALEDRLSLEEIAHFRAGKCAGYRSCCMEGSLLSHARHRSRLIKADWLPWKTGLALQRSPIH